MENNFYVGDVFHRRTIKQSYIEKLVLYTENNFDFLDLFKERWYTTDARQRDYIIRDSLMPTDIEDYRDYQYLIAKNKVRARVK